MPDLGPIRKKIQTEEFDYGTLMEALQQYKKPRDAVTRLLCHGDIIRVKKGLYVFGENYRRSLICKESLANLLYGPSYISLEYALSYYGFIPERVEQITSMTSLRNRIFDTPIGAFAYTHLAPKKMAVGVTTVYVDAQHQFLIATPEKALCDRVAFHKNLTSTEDIKSFVCEGLRIDEEMLSSLQLSLMEDIEKIYRNPAVSSLLKFVKGLS